MGANNRNIQFAKIRARDRVALREEAIRARGYREIQQLVHDLKRPLTTILGLADVMTATLPAGPPRDYAGQIAKTSASMNQTVEELLKEDARQTISAAALMEYVQSQISAFAWRHTVTVDMDRAVAGICIDANLIRLSRALVNLLDNAHLAVRNSARQRIVLSVTVEGQSLLCTVSDNGPGFPDQFTSARWGVSEWGSTGIGLAFVEEVAKNHGGVLRIANNPGGGAKAVLSLPLA